MNASIFTGKFRIIIAAVAVLLFPSWQCQGASLEWAALPDRERVTITTDFADGLAGDVARIDLHGVLIPYTQVSPELIVNEPPEGAAIFRGTRVLGRSLALVTQTAEFGFIVSRRTPTELVIDFFPDRLGARWRPSSLPPTQELPPDYPVRGAAEAGSPPAPADNPAPAAPDGAAPVEAQPARDAAPAGENAPPAPAPVVLRSDGTPAEPLPLVEHSGTADNGEVFAPGADAPSAAAENAPPSEQATAPETAARAETAARSAPLPQPGLPASVQVADAPASALVPAPASPSAAVPESGQVVAGPPETPQPAQARVIPGVGVPASARGAAVGRAHLGGPETLQAPFFDAEMTERALGPGRPEAQAEAPGAPPLDRMAASPVAQTAQTSGGETVYVDEEGNEQAPPLDPAEVLERARQNIHARMYAEALRMVETLLGQNNLTAAHKEEALHIRAEMLFALNQDNFLEHFPRITGATNTAINFNPASPRNDAALLRLGYLHLKLDNVPEARASFNLMRSQYPDSEHIPLTYYYWGEYYYSRNEFSPAADEFEQALNKYPESRYAREAALGLARSFYHLGYYDKSFEIVDYIEKRWQRFYLEYPPFLNMMGDVAFRLDKLDRALQYYWLYINLEPAGNEADIILTRIGDIYLQQRETAAARNIYLQSARLFPERDGGLVARMRLAESSVNDDPSIASMFMVFDDRYSTRPSEVYTEIMEDYPHSALAPVAHLKLALWRLWNNQYRDALTLCESFLATYPEHELAPRAREVALDTFTVLASKGVQENNYQQMRDIWESFPVVRSQRERLSPESRVALAVSYWNDDLPDQSLALLSPFFRGSKIPLHSEEALSLVLQIYLKYEKWDAVREVARRVELWELTDPGKEQLDFALALAGENLGESSAVSALWEALYENGESLSSLQKAHAAFFLARDAESKRYLEKAYVLGTDALRRLQEEERKDPARADVGKIKNQLSSLMTVAELAGRLRESLDFAQEYLEYLPEEDDERVAVLYRMAGVYRKQGNMEAWHSGLSEIVRRYPTTTYGETAASLLNTAAITRDAAQYSPTGSL